MPLGGDAVDPVGTVTEADIDTWWANGNPTASHWFDDANGDILRTIIPGVGAGHTIEYGPNDAGTSYVLKITGPSINKTWSA